jgi:glycosyltransferase involved in cell wall biosynthesis
VPISVPKPHVPRSGRALFISYNFPPAASAGVFRTLRFVRYLPEFGWEPLVLTVTANSSQRSDDSLEKYLPPVVTVARTRIWQPEERMGRWLRSIRGDFRAPVAPPQEAGNTGHNGGLPAVHGESRPSNHQRVGELERRRGAAGRLRSCVSSLQQLAFQTPDAKIWWAIPALPRACRLVRQWKPDVIFATAPPHSSLLLATWLGRWTRTPVVLDFRDPWARSPWYDAKPTVARRLAPWFERMCVRRASAVILNTQRTTDEFREFYGLPWSSRFETLPNGFDPELLSNLPDPAARESLSQRLELLHPGAVYGKRDLRPLLQAVSRMAQQGKDVHFDQVGVVHQPYDVPAFLATEGLESRVTISGVLSHEATLQRMANSDVLVVIQPGTPLQVPGKLYEMMMFGKPILALAGEGETADLVRRYELGMVADPDDADAIAAALGNLLQHRGTNRSPQARKALVDFDGRNLTGRLAEVFHSVTSRRNLTLTSSYTDEIFGNPSCQEPAVSGHARSP